MKGKRVYKWGNAPLTDGLVRDGLITQPEVVGEIIRDLFKSIKVTREKVIVSISGLAFTYRFLNLPRLKQNLLEEAILRGFKREISLPLEDLYLSWQALPGEEDEQTFFVLGISRYLIDALVQTLEAADVEPYVMDIQPLALARVANRATVLSRVWSLSVMISLLSPTDFLQSFIPSVPGVKELLSKIISDV